jgi:hypothetical protein
MNKTLPPDPENLNTERAKWAKTALQAFHNETGADEEDVVSDLLCDLMHLADREDWLFDDELERARRNYEAEIAPPTLLQAAELVIDRWSEGDLAEAVRQLNTAIKAATAGHRRSS